MAPTPAPDKQKPGTNKNQDPATPCSYFLSEFSGVFISKAHKYHKYAYFLGRSMVFERLKCAEVNILRNILSSLK